jgi:hypothetical protein
MDKFLVKLRADLVEFFLPFLRMDPDIKAESKSIHSPDRLLIKKILQSCTSSSHAHANGLVKGDIPYAMSYYLHLLIGEEGPKIPISEDPWKPPPQEQLDDYWEDLQQAGKGVAHFGSLNGNRLMVHEIGYVEVEDPGDPLLDTRRDGWVTIQLPLSENFPETWDALSSAPSSTQGRQFWWIKSRTFGFGRSSSD